MFRSLLRAMALKLDLGFYEGSGVAPEILGVRNVPGIQEIPLGDDGGPLTSLDPFADAIGMLAQANASATAIVMHPREWRTLLKLKAQATGSNEPLLLGAVSEGPVPSTYGVPVHLSSQLSTTETQGTADDTSSAYVYEAREVIALRRTQIRIEISGDVHFRSDQSAMRAISRWDLVVPNPAAVVRIRGITP